MKFAGAGEAGCFVVVFFEDMGKGPDGEVVGFAADFLFAFQWYFVKEVFAHEVYPVLGVGEQHDEFDPFRFAEHMFEV